MARSSGWATFLATFSHRPFVFFSAGNLASLIGTWAQRVTVAWLAWQMTGSELWVGLIAFADLIPGVLVAPFAGALVDRTNLLRLCTILQVMGAVQGVALYGFSQSGLLDINLLFALTFALGIVSALDHPARLAIMPDLVPRELLAAGVGLSATMFNLARFLGPLGAGVAISSGGVEIVFIINATSYLVFAIALVAVAKHIHPIVRLPSMDSFLADTRAGFSYVSSQAGISGIMAILVVTSLGVRPIIELLPPFADELVEAGIAGHGAAGLAILTSTMAIGAIAASLVLTIAGRPATLDRLVVLAHLVSAISLMLFLVLPNMLLRLAAIAICGCSLVFLGVGTQMILQLRVDPTMRGRVLSLFTMLNRGLPALGALAMGWLATYAGLHLSLFLGAAAAMLSVGFSVWKQAHR